MARIQWAANDDKLNAADRQVKDRIRALYRSINGLGQYNMEGAQSASTTAKLPDGKSLSLRTTDTQHSEMVVTHELLNRGVWVVQDDGSLTWATRTRITQDQFETNVPHCGYCTLTMKILGLPLSSPTRGNYNFASQFNYLLPVALANDPRVLMAYRTEERYTHSVFKRQLNLLVNNDAKSWVLQLPDLTHVNDNGPVAGPPGPELAVMSWVDAVNPLRMQKFRTQIWRCIYEVNREG